MGFPASRMCRCGGLRPRARVRRLMQGFTTCDYIDDLDAHVEGSAQRCVDVVEAIAVRTAEFVGALQLMLNADKSVRFASTATVHALLRGKSGLPECFRDLGVDEQVGLRMRAGFIEAKMAGMRTRFARCVGRPRAGGCRAPVAFGQRSPHGPGGMSSGSVRTACRQFCGLGSALRQKRWLASWGSLGARTSRPALCCSRGTSYSLRVMPVRFPRTGSKSGCAASAAGWGC